MGGLSVAPGMSDYPFYQQVPGSCLRDTDFNCFTQVRPMYLENLRKGFLSMDNTYHPALKIMNILNEPDLKMPPTADNGGPEGPVQMCRAIISAFDAMLDAEQEAGVTGPLINFTATFSYAICSSCKWFQDKPGLGQMAMLDDAMKNPEKYGYTPKNDITAAYAARFTHSFNTQNPATDLQHQFLDDYAAFFPTTPVYIGEYHRVAGNQTEDLETILELAERNPLFLGISFFEYQVAYWKTGSEMDFGMFGLGDYKKASMPYFSKTYDVWCVVPQDSPASGTTLPGALAKAYGGEGVDASTLCAANPEGVPCNQKGYEEIASHSSQMQMALFVENVINHLGAVVKDAARSDLGDFAKSHVDGGKSDFAKMASYLGSKPDWIQFDSDAKCMANRNVDPSAIAGAIGWVCSKATAFSCSDLPYQCANNTYRTGDYVFSRYYKELGAAANPLVDCSLGGAAIFASSELYGRWTGAAQCVDGGATVTTTSQSVTEPETDAGTTTAELASTETSTLQPHHDVTADPPKATTSAGFLPPQSGARRLA